MSHLFCTGFPPQASIGLWHAGFAKIFLGKYIGCYLAPLFGNLHVFHFKHHLTGWIANNTGTVIVFELIKYIYVVFCKATTKLQSRLAGILFFTCHNLKEFSWVLVVHSPGER